MASTSSRSWLAWPAAKKGAKRAQIGDYSLRMVVRPLFFTMLSVSLGALGGGKYLDLDLDDEIWRCHVCDHRLGSARDNYKEGCLVHARDPVAQCHRLDLVVRDVEHGDAEFLGD